MDVETVAVIWTETYWSASSVFFFWFTHCTVLRFSLSCSKKSEEMNLWIVRRRRERWGLTVIKRSKRMRAYVVQHTPLRKEASDRERGMNSTLFVLITCCCTHSKHMNDSAFDLVEWLPYEASERRGMQLQVVTLHEKPSLPWRTRAQRTSRSQKRHTALQRSTSAAGIRGRA